MRCELGERSNMILKTYKGHRVCFDPTPKFHPQTALGAETIAPPLLPQNRKKTSPARPRLIEFEASSVGFERPRVVGVRPANLASIPGTCAAEDAERKRAIEHHGNGADGFFERAKNRSRRVKEVIF